MLNQRDLDVLAILFSAEKSLTATEIVEYKRGLTQSTVTAVLRKLLKDGLVEVDGVTHSGKVLSRTYKSSEKSLQAVTDYFVKMYGMFADVVSMSDMCRCIFGIDSENVEINKKEMAQLKKFLKEYERSLKETS